MVVKLKLNQNHVNCKTCGKKIINAPLNDIFKLTSNVWCKKVANAADTTENQHQTVQLSAAFSRSDSLLQKERYHHV